MKLDTLIRELVNYAVEKGVAQSADEAYATARLLEIFGLSDFAPEEINEKRELAPILSDLCDKAYELGLIASNTVVYRDLFDTALMGTLMPRPSETIRIFEEKYKENPREATDWFYKLSCDSNYIRRDRIAKDMKWSVDSEYGEMDITVNLSKPEKDPKAIAAAKLLPQTDFPRCALCHENEGFAGNLSKPARQTLRQIPFDMAGERWYIQYSPYVYYNEHCIALSAKHEPMKIDEKSFEKLLGFVTHFPHYFIGQNADLPIVGGSILSHDHMQGGRYTFAMERAQVREKIEFSGYEDVEAGIVEWPMSVIRLRSASPARISALASKILNAWRGYTDTTAMIIAESDGQPHNTVTPIARRRGEDFEIDIVLRNNLTTEEHPLGLYHPHAEHHNIKKENIGLIEVMGLAVLPARLKSEIALMKEAILSGRDFREIAEIEKHAEWFSRFEKNYGFTEENTEKILMSEIGKTFVRVLEDAGVYKRTEEGRAAFARFIASVNA